MQQDASEQQLWKIADALPHIVWSASPDGNVDYVNRAAFEYAGLKLDVESQNWLQVVHPDDVERCLEVWRYAVGSGTYYSTEFRIFYAADREYRWQAVSAKPVRDAAGNITRWYGTAVDIHERKLADQKISQLAGRFTSTLGSMPDGFFMLDCEWRFTYLNSAAEELLGRKESELQGKVIWQEFSGSAGTTFYCEYHRAFTEQRAVQFQEFYSPLNRWFEVNAFPTPEGLSVHLRDITERKSTEQEIERLAFYDQLTGLPNRQLLADRLRRSLLLSARSRHHGALMLIDLDHFSTLNDTLGHDQGDQLLMQLAYRLSACARESDTIARLGGDEFAVILEELSTDFAEAAGHARTIAEKIMAMLGKPFLLNHQEYRITASIGVTLYGSNNSNANEHLKRAELAMYRAKSAGRSSMRFFDPEMEAAISAQAMMEHDLRESLQNELFTLHYQPQVNSSNQVIGVEALLRWTHPSRKSVPPSVFIPLAEEMGMISALGRWVLKTACLQLVSWSSDPELGHLTMAVNVSAREFHHDGFVQQVLDIIEETGARPERLKLELTESILIEDMANTISKMAALKKYGVSFSLDDYGTGYSSLSYLRQLPIKQLKIDRSFIREVPGNAHDAAIVEAILALAHKLDLAVIAEGVETLEQFQYLVEKGCQAFQGYLFSRPASAGQMTLYMQQALTEARLYPATISHAPLFTGV